MHIHDVAEVQHKSYACPAQFSGYKQSIKARILALCLVKSSSEMASTLSNSCSSRICFMHADLSEAADFGVAASCTSGLTLTWGCCRCTDIRYRC